jgi:hypothetical protein
MNQKLVSILTLKPLQNMLVHDSPKLHAHYSPINNTALLIIRIIALLYLSGYYVYDFVGS